jgi:hypothetical protein
LHAAKVIKICKAKSVHTGLKCHAISAQDIVFLSNLVRDLFGNASGHVAEFPNKSRTRPEAKQKKTGEKGLFSILFLASSDDNENY